jgi:hypothetical protein
MLQVLKNSPKGEIRGLRLLLQWQKPLQMWFVFDSKTKYFVWHKAQNFMTGLIDKAFECMFVNFLVTKLGLSRKKGNIIEINIKKIKEVNRVDK